MKKYPKKIASILKQEGFVALAIKSLQKIEKSRAKISTNPSRKIKFVSLVDVKDVMEADWSNNPYQSPKLTKRTKTPYTINWVMSPPRGGGGHQNIFRFIEHLDSLGHKNNVYLYSTTDHMTVEEAAENVRAYCNAKNVDFKLYDKNMDEADVLFATGWETAYPVFNQKTKAKKMYFVQDFEPYFYAIGTNYVLAENTYKFGFHGITAGGFLSNKLSTEYGMKCDSYDFAADLANYRYTNQSERKEVFFYARPVTERRGFELGIMALELFHKMMPDYTINLAGWDVSEYEIPFPYVNHKAMQISELSDLYNKCGVALVISLTNMSLLPPELLACGTIPVVNDGPNNRLVSDNPYIQYVEASPAALAQRMAEVLKKKDLKQYSKKATSSIGKNGWADSKDVFMKTLDRELGNV
jgi:glycosyltransferase involved in cell wall biosynthesis